MRAWFLAGLLASSSALAGTPDKGHTTRLAVVDNFVWEGTPFLNKVKTEKKLRALGTVTKESIEDVPNPYENGTIRYTTLIFVEGLEVRFRKVTPTDDPDLVQVVVTSAKWPIKNGLRVGVPVSKVFKALGSSNDRAQLLQYNGESERVEFTVSHGHVTRIEFDYYAE